MRYERETQDTKRRQTVKIVRKEHGLKNYRLYANRRTCQHSRVEYRKGQKKAICDLFLRGQLSVAYHEVSVVATSCAISCQRLSILKMLPQPCGCILTREQEGRCSHNAVTNVSVAASLDAFESLCSLSDNPTETALQYSSQLLITAQYTQITSCFDKNGFICRSTYVRREAFFVMQFTCAFQLHSLQMRPKISLYQIHVFDNHFYCFESNSVCLKFKHSKHLKLKGGPKLERYVAYCILLDA